MDKLKSKPGKLKLATVVVGLLAMALTAATFDNGAYYKATCDSRLTDPRGSIRHLNIHHNSSNSSSRQRPPYGPPSRQQPTTCEQLTPNTHDNCQRMNDKHNEELDYAINSGIPGAAEAAKNIPKLKPCPSKWLVNPSVFIIAIAWTISLIMLLIWLFVDLNQKIPSFPKIDRIGHLVCGGLMLLMGALMAGFLLWVLLSDYPCHGTDLEEHQEKMAKLEQQGAIWGDPERERQSSPTTLSDYRLPYFEMYYRFKILDRSDYKTCASHTNRVYQPWLLLIGTVLTAVTGILYIVTGMTLKAPRMQPPTPGMIGQGQQLAQQPSQMGYQQQQQQYPQMGYQQTPSQMGYQQQYVPGTPEGQPPEAIPQQPPQ